ncbi:hypothetical protein PP677_003829 [Salmonella enterica]|nr:hypothetical protein [Salmonella enterica]EIV1999668.1 hypothetical protein [Salmonella enterica subsp. enterica serovar Telelkebir]EHH9729272.1 hypothetical protein [Salmonella enterica]EKL0001532.1 hypothetical protein [Salmonella enterica]EKO9615855.1 hypothetical protein [Salmonella enterica]
MLLHRIFIVLAGAGFRIYQKRNQTLKTGTPHENNPVAEKPHSYGAKRNAGYERYVTNGRVKNAVKSDAVTTAVKGLSLLVSASHE